MKKLLVVSVVIGVVVAADGAAAQKETRGVSKTEIVLGMHTDLSGPAATYGVSSSNAVKMRFDELNDKGGVHGRKIKLIVEDTQYQVPRAVQAGAKLINRDRIFAMVAGLGTPMNNALFKEQLDAGVPNLFPLSAARSMFEPFHKLKFYGAATYVDQVKAGINYFVTKKGKKAVCAMYQDTDFGKEVLDGVQAQAEKMKIKLAETVNHKPTDQDFTAQITKLKAAGCDLVVLGTIVRDSIVPYATARKIGWTDVDFLGSAATYDMFVAAAQGGVTEGLYAMGLTDMPYRDTLGPAAGAWFDRYKERYKVDPNIGAVYGHVAADLTVVALEKTGIELNLDNFVRAMESIRGYKDIFNGPEANFGPDKHQGASSSFLAVVKGGRWVRLTEPLTY
ncbi:MAG TPA: ABC transporter substrate-binding protein [Methylomirabilota bacterium]|jgi:branched-chain amino acid transport system substrate-binding protein|nr:ABC transporter substrate-binding protein [Methylomirabilota bacterium]